MKDNENEVGIILEEQEENTPEERKYVEVGESLEQFRKNRLIGAYIKMFENRDVLPGGSAQKRLLELRDIAEKDGVAKVNSSRVVPPVIGGLHEIVHNKRPPEFSHLSAWDKPDDLNSMIRQLEDAKKPYSIERLLVNGRSKKIRVWSQTFKGEDKVDHW